MKKYYDQHPLGKFINCLGNKVLEPAVRVLAPLFPYNLVPVHIHIEAKDE